MERIGDAFVWPFRDPKWVEKVAIIGLISLIPIVGGINGLGWMLASIERLRAGKEELPPRRHRRGLRPAGDLSPRTAVSDQHPDRGPYASGRRLHQRVGVIRVHRRTHLHRPLLAGDGGLDHPELRARLRTETGGGTRCR